MRIERPIVFWIAALVVFAGLLWLLRPVLLPFVMGMALAYVLDPLASRLARRGMSRLVAALLILGGFVVALAILLIIIVPVMANQLAAFIEHVPAYALRLQTYITDPAHPWVKRFVGDNVVGKDSSVGDLIMQGIGYLTHFLASLWSKGEVLISVFSLVIITPVVAFYLICDWPRIISTVDRLIPLPQRDTVHRLAREIDASISSYVRGQSAVCLILGSYYAIGLTLAGLSYGLLIGVVSGLISFIPYVGSLTALVLSLAVAVAEFFPDWTRILIVVGVVMFGQLIEGNVLSPKLVGKSVGLHPVWIIFALFAFGYLFGFVGLLLAVPLAAATAVLMRFAIARYRASPLYSGTQPV